MDDTQYQELVSRIRSFFSPGGALAKRLEGFEPRASQVRMALAALGALWREEKLVVEAGTGTGKTLAYLVPALAAGKRIVVSTGTKNLQEQLFFKDIPFLQGLGGRFTAALMKGRGNYLCRRRLRLFRQQPMLKGMEEVDQYQAVEDWAAQTQTGDFSELRGFSESTPLLGSLSCRSDNCVGRKCPLFGECWIVRMRQTGGEADVLIVNHHLLFADLAVRDTGFGAVLPEYERLILDEAHEIEDVATSYFGIEASNWRFESLERDAVHELAGAGVTDARPAKLIAEIGVGARNFFERLRPPWDRFMLHSMKSDELLESFSSLEGKMQAFEAEIAAGADPPESLVKLGQRSEELRQSLRLLLEGDDPDYVFWGERRGRGVVLKASPIDVSQSIRRHLFDGIGCAILTSATLAVDGSFEFLRNRLGLGKASELLLESPFDFAGLTRLYIPTALPEPREEGYLELAVKEIVRILDLTEGRAFVLFTSLRTMERAHDLLLERVPYPLLLQGTASRRELLERFYGEDGAVLLASASFWQGVDVRGPRLSCVIIDKLPFAVPDDPIVQARLERVRSGGGEPFWEFQVPSAALSLKQGLGRLVRSSTDRGIMAVLDNRLLKKRYGQVFLRSLHGSPVITKYEELLRWWERR